jgi:hypothetical protein
LPPFLLEWGKEFRYSICEARNTYIERVKVRKRKKFIQSLNSTTESDIMKLLSGPLGIRKNDTVMVHSSMDVLKIDFSPLRLLDMLREIVGKEGLLLFPSYPIISASRFMKKGKAFDVKKTPTTAGLLAELARRSNGALRSLHPTKSVCAIGKNAREIVSGHEKCEYPFDEMSPYGKFVKLNGKVIGLGLYSYECLMIMHCIQGVLGEAFPVPRDQDTYYNWDCIDYSGKTVNVKVLAYHYIGQLDCQRYIENYFPNDICYDFEEKRRPFFVCQSKLFLNSGVKLARQGITWYTFPERGVEK